jgi:hypothetical protein
MVGSIATQRSPVVVQSASVQQLRWQRRSWHR